MTDANITPEAVERLANIEDTGGCADLQFTGYAPTLRALSARIAELEAENRELAMQCIASDGQAQMAYEEQVRLEAKLAVLSKSGQAAVDRWDSIDWKDEKHTADYINDLRATLAQLKGTDQ